MKLWKLERTDRSFWCGDVNTTEHYYSGTHQIVLSGECIDEALDALENIDDNIDIFFHDDEVLDYCYIVAPELSEKEFFEKVVAVVEEAVTDISADDGTYLVKRKIPTTPGLPEKDNADKELFSGALCYKTTVHLGRGYGTRFSKVDIFLSTEGRKVSYRVQRFNNDVMGPRPDGEPKIFTGLGAQWQAVCFAYGIDPSEGGSKESAKRSKKFLYSVVGELMSRFWSNNVQPSYMNAWKQAQLATPALA